MHVDSLLRFPEKTFIDYFKPTSTMIIMEGNVQSKKKKKKVNTGSNIHQNKDTFRQKVVTKGINNIPIGYLSSYYINTGKVIAQVQKKAREILESFKHHPLYKDPHFQRKLLLQISQIIDRIAKVKNFLETVPVSCIVISHPHALNRILAIAAAEKGIPTICMQHGIISSEFGYLPKIATIDAVYGKFEKDWYMTAGAHEQSIEIIGHPRFDQAFTRPKMTRTKFNKQEGINNNKKTIMVVLRGKQNIDDWRIFLKRITEKLDVNILIKDHPREYNHDLIRDFPSIHFSSMRNLYDIIPNVDCVVAYSSTVGLEAMLHKKPVFILTDKFPGYSGYYDGLGKMTQSDPQRLAEIVIEYFNTIKVDKSAGIQINNFLSKAYPDFSSSGERLIQTINRLIN
ncbi:spore coat polysaccharide biosynthesis protein SpsB [Ornithinibacillus scapharcae]|uniref:spore coat polysaccharide biosynthesis protein SpsB n=1 Tax=Ornithinibacillus scapharcae TaxID=1147159 RepID=UPI000225AB3E|nr:spore coat polysaccharide biosynthesis protein SpsB [Ornithinibacillus scapharcae]